MVRFPNTTLVVVLASAVTLSHAQTSAPGVEGVWQGTLGGQLRMVLRIEKAADGLLLGQVISVDQGNSRIPIDRIEVSGDRVRLTIPAISASFEGTLTVSPRKLAGTFTQLGRSQPLELTPANDAASSAASPPAPRLPPGPLPFGVPIEVRVPVAPTPVKADGRIRLAYELHLTNLSPFEFALTRLEVLSAGRTIASFEGTALNDILQRVGSQEMDRRPIGPGRRTVVFVWLDVDPGAPAPDTLRHRLTLGERSLEAGDVRINTAAPIVIGPPLRGANWIAANGPANDTSHRRALLIGGGGGFIAQRFAIDWVQTVSAGAGQITFSGSRTDNKSYAAYGDEAIAVLDAQVVGVKDGIPENVPGPASRAVPITQETIGGNYVILDLGAGHYAFYGHLQPGSLKVRQGDRVKRGQLLGLVGNTGNSTEPHLHFHIADASSGLLAEGIPFVFESFEQMTADGKWETHRGEIPLNNARVRFP